MESESQEQRRDTSSSDENAKRKKNNARLKKNVQDWQNQLLKSERPRRQLKTEKTLLQESSSSMEEAPEESPSNQTSVFTPDIEVILWRRTVNDASEYYVKYRNYSYLWCDWISENDLLERDKNGKQKINRFSKVFEKKLSEIDPDELNETNYFDPSYIEIDRIISSTEMFMVIHPKKANEIKGRWNEYLSVVVSKLLNYNSGRVRYGVYFMDPVNPERDGCLDYRKIITQPMDLSNVMNRLHLDYYKNSQQFWYELGLVFKNCKKYNNDPECQLRILGDTLSEVAVQLYLQWYQMQSKQYNRLLELANYEANPSALDELSEIDKENIIKQIQQERINYTSDLEYWNPGCLSFEWIEDEAQVQPPNKYLTHEVDLMTPVDPLYMIKWKNLSYIHSTWEDLQNLQGSQQKLLEFRAFNRAMDKETRNQMLKNFQKHKTLLDYEQRKKNRISQMEVQEIKRGLYQLDIGKNAKPFQYTPRTQTIYKDRKLLRDYQLESLNWMIDAYYNNRNLLLADEMGLGKTIQSISFLNHLHSMEQCRGPFLIVAPLSTLQHWKRSVEEWTNLNAVLYYDSQGQQGREACRLYEWYYTDISLKGNVLTASELHKFQILITSYEVFNQDHQTVLQHIPFQFIIVDEAHRLKNQNAKILSGLKKLICQRVMILTGTPVQNNPEELWSLLNFIEPDTFPSFFQFKQVFGDLQTAESIEKLNKSLKPYILRRQKEDVEQSIPPLQENIIDVELTNVQKTLYRAMYERNKSALIQGFSAQAAQITTLNNLDMHLRKLCNHPLMLKEMYNDMILKCTNDGDYYRILIDWSGKMVLLDKMLQKFLKEDKKVLIFSQFTSMLSLLDEYLKINGIRYEKITGDVKSIDRQNSIDRFNDPKKGRQVFLLSTKAGGQGINLTAAEIVIIFDSDWNPQNDIQATARAHRIGQDKQVAVYRFITKGTYEAKMFERAVTKLGLDQAIFLGGEYKQVANNGTADGSKKFSKKDLEILLKQGSLGLLESMNQDQPQDLNIDEILNNTRVAKYSLINGSYTISKQTFVSEQSTTLDVNDPNFWQIVLKNQESKSQKLLKQIQEENIQLKSLEGQKEFMLLVAECINHLMDSKISMQGYDADDENTLLDVLNLVGFNKHFEAGYQQLATNWICELGKPSRRFKKITEADLEINVQVRQMAPKQPEPPVKEQPELNWSDMEEYKKLQSKSKQDLLCRLCAICEKVRCDYFCRGFCRRQYHAVCLTLPEIEENDIKYLCEDCQLLKGTCFMCGKQGSFDPFSCRKKPTAEKQFIDDDDFIDNEQYVVQGKRTRSKMQQFAPQVDLVKCNMQNCHKLYHFSCVQTNRNFKIIDGISQRFRCSLHSCDKCRDRNSSDAQNMVSCLRCPKSYHSKCAPKGIHRVTRKYIVCGAHKEEQVQPAIKKKVKIEQRKTQKRSHSSSIEI